MLFCYLFFKVNIKYLSDIGYNNYLSVNLLTSHSLKDYRIILKLPGNVLETIFFPSSAVRNS